MAPKGENVVELIEYSAKKLEMFQSLYCEPNPTVVAALETDKEKHLADAYKVAEFLQLLYPSKTISILPRWKVDQSKFNKDGSIWTYDIFVEGEPIFLFLSWFPSEQRSDVTTTSLIKTKLPMSYKHKG